MRTLKRSDEVDGEGKRRGGTLAIIAIPLFRDISGGGKPPQLDAALLAGFSRSLPRNNAQPRQH